MRAERFEEEEFDTSAVLGRFRGTGGDLDDDWEDEDDWDDDDDWEDEDEEEEQDEELDEDDLF